MPFALADRSPDQFLLLKKGAGGFPEVRGHHRRRKSPQPPFFKGGNLPNDRRWKHFLGVKSGLTCFFSHRLAALGTVFTTAGMANSFGMKQMTGTASQESFSRRVDRETERFNRHVHGGSHRQRVDSR
jgi:hypothetical protein